MIEIMPAKESTIETEESVTVDELVDLLENNRSRVRALVNSIITVCGLILSASFVVLFFILKESSNLISSIVPIILFSVVISLLISMISGLISIYVPSPTAISTKIKLIDTLVGTYRTEQRRAAVSVTFLLIGIVLFFLSLVILGLTYL
jgi:hypothetical protein